MSLVKYDPSKRATALQTLQNPIFDKVRDKKLEATHYSCLENLYLVEKPINFTLDKQIDLNYRMKYIVIDWLFGVKLKFRLKLRTYYIALYLHDSLDFSIDREDYQLFSASCLYLASNYNELFPPEINDFIYITANSYSKKQFFSMSNTILKSINFKMVFSTCYDFHIQYGEFYNNEINKLSKNLLLFVSTLPDKLYQTKPDQVALMTIMMACMYYGEKFKHMSKVTNKSIQDKLFCIDIKANLLPSAKLMFKRDIGIDVNTVIDELCKNELLV